MDLRVIQINFFSVLFYHIRLFQVFHTSKKVGLINQAPAYESSPYDINSVKVLNYYSYIW